MTTTPETRPLDLDRLKFYHGDPRAFAQCLTEMRKLRARHYQQNEGFTYFVPGQGFVSRTPEQIDRFSHGLTPETWLDPTKVPGRRPGQRYKNLTVVAAFDKETDLLQGYSYAGINVNSRIEQKYADRKLLRYPAMAIGALERYVKQKRNPEKYSYIWMREIVRDPDSSDKLQPLLGAMAISEVLKTQGGPRKSTLYPYVFDPSIDSRLLPVDRSLAQYDYWGYASDGSLPHTRQVFGPTADEHPAWQGRWESASSLDTIHQMAVEAGVQDLPPSKLWLAA